MILQRILNAILFIKIIALYGVIARSQSSIIKNNLISTTDTSAISIRGIPTNNNNSIQYHLFTPENPKEICYFEPDVSNDCTFNSSYESKILIHGYTVKLLPGNFFEQFKDTMLEFNKYNIFIVNWTRYNGYPYSVAVQEAYRVGINVGQMVNFLVSNKGVNPLDVHIIGHSLGAHIAGVAGKQVHNLSRVTGLDPAGPLFTKPITYNRLTDTSANFVDVMHTSNSNTGEGYGISDPIGSIDIYPNGGNQQPACKIGRQYRDADGELFNITSVLEVGYCNHDIALIYFMNSIHTCKYPCVECANYQMFSQGRCGTGANNEDRMGLYCTKIPGLPNESTFYLNTSDTSPFCEI